MLTCELQRWKVAKKKHGRKTLCYASLLTQIYIQTMAMYPTPRGIKPYGDKPVLSTRDFQIKWCRSLAVLLMGGILRLHRKVLRKGTKGHSRSPVNSVAIAILNIIQEIALGFFTFSVLRIKFRASHNIGKHSNYELYPQLPIRLFWITKLEHR